MFRISPIQAHHRQAGCVKRLGHVLICTQTAVRRCVVPTTIGILFLVADQADVALLRLRDERGWAVPNAHSEA